MKIRTRFAPSPTGLLHIGGARTALFSWLHARHHGGEFVLRIEDTDKQRSHSAYTQKIIKALQWLQLDWNGEPFLQSQRMPHYRRAVEDLLSRDQAYLCYCTEEELAAMRAAQRAAGQKPRYDGRCRQRTTPRAGIKPVVRIKTPTTGEVCFTDLVKGKVAVHNRELDDMVLLRSDQSPTYNLTAVVDDIDMQISHVIRGDDHLNNTFRQLHLYRALQKEPPQFAHLPLILDETGKRFSKRDGAVDVNHYRAQGYCYEAVINYLLRLGWSYGDQEVFSRDEMIERFDLAAVNASAVTINAKKLLWLNQHYLKSLPLARLQTIYSNWLERTDADHAKDTKELMQWLPCMRTRYKTLAEMTQATRDIINDKLFAERVTAAVQSLQSEDLDVLQSVLAHVQVLSAWQQDAVRRVLHEICTATAITMKQMAPLLRCALCAGLSGPSVIETMVLLGRERVVVRLQKVIDML